MSDYSDLIAWLSSGDDERELEAASALRELVKERDGLKVANERLVNQLVTDGASAIKKIDALKAENEQLGERVSQLTSGLTGAIDMLDHWATYVPDYFRSKHNIDADFAYLRAALAGREGVMSRRVDVVALTGDEYDTLQDEITRLRSLLERARPHINAWDGDSESMHDAPAVIARAALAGDARIVEDYIDIVFDGPPGPVAGRFVEVEDSQRRSIRFGEWTKRDDGFWVLRVANEQASAHRSAQIRAACQEALRALDTYAGMYRHHMTVQLISARAGLRDVLTNVDNEGV